MPHIYAWPLVAISICNDLIWIIINSFMALKFRRHRKHQALKKRTPFLIYVMTIFIMLSLVRQSFIKFMVVNDNILPFELEHIADVRTHRHAHGSAELVHEGQIHNDIEVINSIANIIYFFTLHGVIIALVGRTWMLRFNIEWALELQQHQWFIHINSNIEEKQWYARHRKDWGSKRYIYTIALSYYLIEAVLLSLYSESHIVIGVDALLLLFELLVVIYLWNIIPTFNDAFLIERELQIFIPVAVLAVIINSVCSIAYTVFAAHVHVHLYGFLIWQTVFTNCIGLMGVILTGYVVQLHPELLSQRCRALTLRSEALNDVDMMQIINTDNTETGHLLEDILQNDEWVICLFQHLSHEFSVELLIGYIEFNQFKQLMSNDAQLMKDAQDIMGRRRIVINAIEMAQILPQSKIVYEIYNDIGNNMKRYVSIANDLYLKYIVYDSEFEVNISGRCKSNIRRLMEKLKGIEQSVATFTQKEQYEMFTLFDAASDQVRILLSCALSRYENSNNRPNAEDEPLL